MQVLFLLRCPEIRCSKKSAAKVAGEGRKRSKGVVPDAIGPRPAVRGWALLGIGQISKNI